MEVKLDLKKLDLLKLKVILNSFINDKTHDNEYIDLMIKKTNDADILYYYKENKLYNINNINLLVNIINQLDEVIENATK